MILRRRDRRKGAAMRHRPLPTAVSSRKTAHNVAFEMATHAMDGHDTRAIQAYLGHRNIQNTTRYTALAPQRFKEFFRN
jgi:site-specific recombinase XerD